LHCRWRSRLSCRLDGLSNLSKVDPKVAQVELEVCADLVEVENCEDGRRPHLEADAQRVGRAQSSQTGILDGSQVLH